MGQSPPGNTYNEIGDRVPLLNGPTEFGASHPTPVLWTTAPTRICKAGDLLFCVRGSTTGRMNWADQAYCVGRGVAAFRAKSSSSDTRFIYYTLVNELPRLLSRCAGSVFPNLSKQDVETFEIWWPDTSTRSTIAHILGALDDKIELNRRMKKRWKPPPAPFSNRGLWILTLCAVRARHASPQRASPQRASPRQWTPKLPRYSPMRLRIRRWARFQRGGRLALCGIAARE